MDINYTKNKTQDKTCNDYPGGEYIQGEIPCLEVHDNSM